MILPNPIIFTKPLHVWLGMLTFILLTLQILTGLRYIKAPLWVHTKLLWRILILLGLIHAFYGFQIYFL